MKALAFLSTGLAQGGAETQLTSIAAALHARGWEILVISMLPPQYFHTELVSQGIEVKSLDMRRGVPDLRAIPRTISMLRERKPIALISFMFHANMLAQIAGRIAGVPIVVTSIRTENFGGFYRERIESLIGMFSEVITTNSALVAERLVKRHVVSTNRVRVIPNGIIVSRYRQSADPRQVLRTELGIHSEDFLWLAVGRLEAAKDYPTMLNAFRRAISVKPSYLLIAGQGPLLEQLNCLRHLLGIEDRVRFLGLRNDVPALLSAADGFLLSSAWEGLPNCVMEASAAGLPVVATRVGGTPELIEDGVSGFLTRPQDSKALSRSMLRLMALGEQERRLMGERARKHIEMHYGLATAVNLWEDLIVQLVREKGLTLLV